MGSKITTKRENTSILVIDDQPHLQQYLSEEFTDEMFNVYGVRDTRSALEYVKDRKPDLVILELYIEGFEGWEMLHYIKTRYPCVPVLIVTAYDNYSADPRVFKADGYMVKDFSCLNQLKKRITDLLMVSV